MDDAERLLEALRPKFLSLAGALGAGADREDWAQEALVHCWTQARRGRAPTLVGYMWTVGKRRIYDLYRQGAVQRRKFFVISLSVLPLDDSPWLIAPIAPEPLGLESVAGVLRQSVSGRMLLRVADGWGYEILHRRYGLPMGTVKSRLWQARIVGRREVARCCPEVAEYHHRILQ